MRSQFFNIFLRPIFHTSSVLHPSLNQLSTVGTSSTDAYEILTQALELDDGENVAKRYISEFEELKKRLVSRQKEIELNYDISYNMAETAALLVYLTVRTCQPETVLETGVGNGVSSYYILNALNRNNKGSLISVDINSNVGGLLDNLDKEHWLLKIIDKRDIRSEFKKLVDNLPIIDVFIHDSEHGYKAQMHEYNAVYERIRKGGILASDDVDFSYAFVDFCLEKRIKPLFLVTSDRVFGLLQKKML